MKVVILGGGLTGLSTAYHLGGQVPVIERDPEPGGVARSVAVGDFVFDLTGHLLHFKDPRIGVLLDHLVPGLFVGWDRRASIWRDGVKTEYPFQVNTHGHPPELIADCLVGFVATLGHAKQQRNASFKEWILDTFGDGFARHFFLPYNEKFWRRDLSEITADWVSWAIPRPDVRQVIEGAVGVVARGLGYNPQFRYPKSGGIGQLPDALASSLSDLRLGSTVTSVDLNSRRVHLADGTVLGYDRLVSTLPLPALVAMSNLAPADKAEATRLRHIGVVNFNVGIARANCWPDHWTYFPEPDLPFYRVGVPTNFSTGVAPAGTTSLYVEVTYRPESEPDIETLWAQVMNGLIRVGIVRAPSEIVMRHVVQIPYAYVVFDDARQTALPSLQSKLAASGVTSVGRYGGWEYSSMEKALLDGIDTADQLKAEGWTSA